MWINSIVAYKHSWKILLKRLLLEFVTEEGATIDSGEERDPEDVELDQNGALLMALNTYALWTGDFEFISGYWEKIKKLANYPFQDVFYHEASGMFHNSREYWERHKLHGVEDGIELMYQFFVAEGLKAAINLAQILKKKDEIKLWNHRLDKLKSAILDNPSYALHDKRGFIKRRSKYGSVQEKIDPSKDADLPKGVPLYESYDHYLNPDASSALPIAMGFVPAESKIAKATLENVEMLWNQGWEGGGYGRYHMSSEADSPGSWPFASLFIARAYMEVGDYEKVWRVLKWLEEFPGSTSGSWFEFNGNRISPPYPQVGIVPWTWAEMITLFIHHILGVKPAKDHIIFRPRLLPGINHLSGSLPIRKSRLNFEVKVGKNIKDSTFRINGAKIDHEENEIRFPYMKGNVLIEAFLNKR